MEDEVDKLLASNNLISISLDYNSIRDVISEIATRVEDAIKQIDNLRFDKFIAQVQERLDNFENFMDEIKGSGIESLKTSESKIPEISMELLDVKIQEIQKNLKEDLEETKKNLKMEAANDLKRAILEVKDSLINTKNDNCFTNEQFEGDKERLQARSKGLPEKKYGSFGNKQLSREYKPVCRTGNVDSDLDAAIATINENTESIGMIAAKIKDFSEMLSMSDESTSDFRSKIEQKLLDFGSRIDNVVANDGSSIGSCVIKSIADEGSNISALGADVSTIVRNVSDVVLSKVQMKMHDVVEENKALKEEMYIHKKEINNIMNSLYGSDLDVAFNNACTFSDGVSNEHHIDKSNYNIETGEARHNVALSSESKDMMIKQGESNESYLQNQTDLGSNKVHIVCETIESKTPIMMSPRDIPELKDLSTKTEKISFEVDNVSLGYRKLLNMFMDLEQKFECLRGECSNQSSPFFSKEERMGVSSDKSSLAQFQEPVRIIDGVPACNVFQSSSCELMETMDGGCIDGLEPKVRRLLKEVNTIKRRLMSLESNSFSAERFEDYSEQMMVQHLQSALNAARSQQETVRDDGTVLFDIETECLLDEGITEESIAARAPSDIAEADSSDPTLKRSNQSSRVRKHVKKSSEISRKGLFRRRRKLPNLEIPSPKILSAVQESQLTVHEEEDVYGYSYETDHEEEMEPPLMIDKERSNSTEQEGDCGLINSVQQVDRGKSDTNANDKTSSLRSTTYDNMTCINSGHVGATNESSNTEVQESNIKDAAKKDGNYSVINTPSSNHSNKFTQSPLNSPMQLRNLRRGKGEFFGFLKKVHTQPTQYGENSYQPMQQVAHKQGSEHLKQSSVNIRDGLDQNTSQLQSMCNDLYMRIEGLSTSITNQITELNDSLNQSKSEQDTSLRKEVDERECVVKSLQSRIADTATNSALTLVSSNFSQAILELQNKLEQIQGALSSYVLRSDLLELLSGIQQDNAAIGRMGYKCLVCGRNTNTSNLITDKDIARLLGAPSNSPTTEGSGKLVLTYGKGHAHQLKSSKNKKLPDLAPVQTNTQNANTDSSP